MPRLASIFVEISLEAGAQTMWRGRDWIGRQKKMTPPKKKVETHEIGGIYIYIYIYTYDYMIVDGTFVLANF